MVQHHHPTRPCTAPLLTGRLPNQRHAVSSLFLIEIFQGGSLSRHLHFTSSLHLHLGFLLTPLLTFFELLDFFPPGDPSLALPCSLSTYIRHPLCAFHMTNPLLCTRLPCTDLLLTSITLHFQGACLSTPSALFIAFCVLWGLSKLLILFTSGAIPVWISSLL